MKNFLGNIFGNDSDESSSDLRPDRKLKIAAAALLLEIAGADDEFSEQERSVIVETLKKLFGITSDEVDEILEETGQALNQSIDLYRFTNRINEHFDVHQKEKLIEMVWRGIYADQHLDGHEDFLVHRFAKLLRLHHSQLIDAKLRIKNEKKD